MSLSLVTITLNEERNIQDCLRSVSEAKEKIVLDSGSRDQTCDLAVKCGARVLKSDFRDFADQKNKALRHATKDWVLLMDADERMTPELSDEIQAVMQRGEKFVFEVGRTTYFFGKKLRFSGMQKDYPIRLWPNGTVQYDQPVHEKIVTNLPVRRMRNKLVHLTTESAEQYRQKLERYIPLEMEMMQQRGVRPSRFRAIWRPAAHFLDRYILNLGFLDGWPGFRFACLAGYYEHIKCKRYFNENN